MPIISNFPSGGSLKVSYTNGILILGKVPTLNDCDWATISAISEAGAASSLWSVGDTKAVTLQGTVGTRELDTTLYVYILGFDHNSALEGTGITFGTFKTAQTDGVDICLINALYTMGTTDSAKNFNINHWGQYNYGGWAACDMRYDILGSTDIAPSNYGSVRVSGDVGYDATTTCVTNPVANTLMAALPSELRAVMKPITKYTDNVGGATNTEACVTATVDYLPLLAEYEIFGARTYSNSYEQNYQAQYDYYAAGNSRVKYYHTDASSPAAWWERSTFYGNAVAFCFVIDGDANSNGARYSYGLAPIFKI